MKIDHTDVVYEVVFPDVSFCKGCEKARKTRDVLLRTKREWVLSTFQIEKKMNVTYPYFLSKTCNDKTASGKFRFEIRGEAVDQGYLSIDEKTGAVYLHKPVDREKYPCFHVVLDVYDAQTSLKTDTELTFNVEVKDVNDNPPRFIQIPKTVTVKENQEEGVLEEEVVVEDLDEENTINSRFNISVIAQYPREPKIQTKWIDNRGLHLKFTGCFNYEKEKEYTITLEAKDHGTPPMSSAAVITLNVVDTNTNMPVFKEREYNTMADEMETRDDLLRLAVDDKDTPFTDGWHAKYFFISGNEEDIFKLETDLNTNEGILSITKKKKYGKITLVDLQIGVENIEPFSKCENGKLIKQGSKDFPYDSVSVKVVMIDTNDPPEFQKTKVDRSSVHQRVIDDHKPQLVNSTLIMCRNKNNKVILSVKNLDADPYSGPFSFFLEDYEDMKRWKLDPAYGKQGGLVSLKPLPFGKYSVSLVIRDQRKNIGRETLEVVVCDCEEKNTCRSKKPLSTAIGAVITGFLLFLILLLIFFCNSGKKPLEDLIEEGNQTLIKYNLEGGISERNAEPILQSPMIEPDGIKQMSITQNSELPPEYFHSEEMYNITRFNMMKSMNYQRESNRGQKGHSMSKSVNNRFSSIRSDLRSDYNLTGQIERKITMLNEDDGCDYAVDQPISYSYEGNNSECEPLEELSLCNSEDDLQFLDDLGPKFKTLADIWQ